MVSTSASGSQIQTHKPRTINAVFSIFPERLDPNPQTLDDQLISLLSVLPSVLNIFCCFYPLPVVARFKPTNLGQLMCFFNFQPVAVSKPLNFGSLVNFCIYHQWPSLLIFFHLFSPSARGGQIQTLTLSTIKTLFLNFQLVAGFEPPH